jgi:hypothetical protein
MITKKLSKNIQFNQKYFKNIFHLSIGEAWRIILGASSHPIPLLQTSLVKKRFFKDMTETEEKEYKCEYCYKKIHKIDYELNKGYCGKCRETIEWKKTLDHIKDFKE